MSIAVRPAEQRGQTRTDWLESYHTFSFGDYMDNRYVHFGPLRVINEDFIAPGQGFGTHPHRDMEIITLLLSGELAHKDSLGNGSVIRPGEVQRMSAGSGIQHSEFNPSGENPAHLLQIWIFPDQKGLTPSYEQKTFPPEGANHQWQLLVSSDGRDGSVQIHQNAELYYSKLTSGSELTYVCPDERMLWLQVTRGDLILNPEVTVRAGDGVGVQQSGELRLKAPDGAEVYLFDLPQS